MGIKMGSFNVFECNSCGKRIELGGPQEFRKDRSGKEKEVRHPPDPDAKIDGLWIFLWCPKCKSVDKKVLVEFAAPSSPSDVWSGTARVKEEYLVEDPERYACNRCGTPMLDRVEEEACPRCKKGLIKYKETIKT
jgi:Zn finger protein HypA/HybF involved in hydrogenase expression